MTQRSRKICACCLDKRVHSELYMTSFLGRMSVRVFVATDDLRGKPPPIETTAADFNRDRHVELQAIRLRVLRRRTFRTALRQCHSRMARWWISPIDEGRNVDRSTGMRSTRTQRFLKLKAER